MEVINCKSCGKIFSHLSGPPICPVCTKKVDEKFQEVKEYIYDNPGVGIHEVSEEMEVSVSQIRQWVREERLTFADNSPTGIDCVGCGVTIKTGKFCNRCKGDLVKDLKSAYVSPVANTEEGKKTKNARMRFLDN